LVSQPWLRLRHPLRYTGGVEEAPLDFAYTGYYNYSSGSLSGETTYGYFWSRTAHSSTYAYYLDFSSGNVNPQNYVNRGYGLPLRCTAK